MAAADHARSSALLAATLGLALAGPLAGCGGMVKTVPGSAAWTPPDYWADEQFVEVHDQRICYLDAGPRDAETLVFVHGWSGNLQNWWDQFEHFADRYRVIVFDAPGHGKSERKSELRYDMQLYLNVLEGLLDELELERVHLVGNSAGGWVAASFAAMHPQRVDRLVLSDATGTRHVGMLGALLPVMSPGMLQRADLTSGEHYPGVDPKSQARQAFVVSFEGTVEEVPYLEVLAELLPHSYTRIPELRLRAIEAPTLIVWGDDDPVVPIKAMRTFERTIADDRSYVVHLGGHTPQMSSPDEFNCALESFLHDQPLEPCKQYALTLESRQARLAGRDAGPRFEGLTSQLSKQLHH